MGLLATRDDSNSKKQSVAAEASRVFVLARQSWGLVERRYKMALFAAVGVMLVTSACNTLLPLLLGKLVDQIQTGTQQHEASAVLLRSAMWFLGLMAAAYLMREVFNVVRRWLVAFSCASIHRDTSVRLVSHLMKVPLATLAQEQVGALHGRIFRSVDGFVHFLQSNFLDFLPALFTGIFALAATAGKQPVLSLAMLGVVPLSFYLTARQIMSQKGVRLRLLRAYEEIDGAVVEQLGGIEYVRAANTDSREIDRLAQSTQRGAIWNCGIRCRCRSSAAPRPSTKACFISWSWRSRSTWRFRANHLRRRAHVLAPVLERDGAAERVAPVAGRRP